MNQGCKCLSHVAEIGSRSTSVHVQQPLSEWPQMVGIAIGEIPRHLDLVPKGAKGGGESGLGSLQSRDDTLYASVVQLSPKSVEVVGPVEPEVELHQEGGGGGRLGEGKGRLHLSDPLHHTRLQSHGIGERVSLGRLALHRGIVEGRGGEEGLALDLASKDVGIAEELVEEREGLLPDRRGKGLLAYNEGDEDLLGELEHVVEATEGRDDVADNERVDVVGAEFEGRGFKEVEELAAGRDAGGGVGRGDEGLTFEEEDEQFVHLRCVHELGDALSVNRYLVSMLVK